MDRNVLLLILDSARAQNMGVYGYHRDTTPFLSEFADSATIFEQARAPAVWSVPSHVSIFSGMHVQEHGVLNDEYDFRLEDDGIFSELSRYGYETGLFSGNAFLTDVESGLQDGFDTIYRSPMASQHLFDEGVNPDRFVGEHGSGAYSEFLKEALQHSETWKSLLNGAVSKLEHETQLDITSQREATGFDYASALLEWVDDTAGPWAACVNLMDTHTPYKPREEYDNWGSEEAWERQGSIDYWSQVFGDDPAWELGQLMELYDGCIRQADSVIEHIVSEVPDDTLVIVTADHGEAFGEDSDVSERRAVGHFMDIHETQTHVPLIVSDPVEDGGKRVTEPVSLVDIPTIIKNRVGIESVDEEFSSPVIAHSGELFSTKCQRLENEYPNREEEIGYAVYSGEGGIRKTVVWEENRFTRHLTPVPFDEQAHQDAVNKLDGEDKLLQGESDSSMSDTAKERLQHLGYIDDGGDN